MIQIFYRSCLKVYFYEIVLDSFFSAHASHFSDDFFLRQGGCEREAQATRSLRLFPPREFRIEAARGAEGKAEEHL